MTEFVHTKSRTSADPKKSVFTGQPGNWFGLPWRVIRTEERRVRLVNNQDSSIALTPFEEREKLSPQKLRYVEDVNNFFADCMNATMPVRGPDKKTTWDYESVGHIVPIYEAVKELRAVIGEIHAARAESPKTYGAQKSWWAALKLSNQNGWWNTIVSIQKETERLGKSGFASVIGESTKVDTAVFAHKIRDSFNAYVMRENDPKKFPLIAIFPPAEFAHAKILLTTRAIKEANAAHGKLREVGQDSIADVKKQKADVRQQRAEAMAPYRELLERTREERIARHAIWRGVVVGTANAFAEVIQRGLGDVHEFSDYVAELRVGLPHIETLAKKVSVHDTGKGQRLFDVAKKVRAAFECFDEPLDRTQDFIAKDQLQRRTEYAERDYRRAVGAKPDADLLDPVKPKRKPRARPGDQPQLGLA